MTKCVIFPHLWFDEGTPCDTICQSNVRIGAPDDNTPASSSYIELGKNEKREESGKLIVTLVKLRR